MLYRLGLCCHTRQLEFWVCRSPELPFDFVHVFHRFPIGGPAKGSKVKNIILGIWTRTHLEVMNKWEHSEPFRTCKLGSGISRFPGVLSTVLRCSNVSVGTNVGRTVKLSPNAESMVGKFLKWFAASLVVSPFYLSSSFHLTNFALVKLLSESGSYMYIPRFFIAYRFLTLRKPILYENIVSKSLLKFVLAGFSLTCKCMSVMHCLAKKPKEEGSYWMHAHLMKQSCDISIEKKLAICGRLLCQFRNRLC